MQQAESDCDMKEKIQKLLDQIKRDFPDGCTGLECSDCPLLTTKGGVQSHLCDAIRAASMRVND